jgi:Calcineurin-like phosphoesterase
LITDLIQSSINVNDDDFSQVIDAAINILKKEQHSRYIKGGKVNGGFAELQIPENLVIVGDIHGDSKSLFKVLEDIAFERFLANPYNKIIFLGDYVDRGSDSIAVLYSICYLKQKYPDSIILMRGNHEAPLEFPFSSHDLPFQILKRYGEDKGRLIYNKKILSLFELLILVTLIPHTLLLVHGGLPTEDIGITTDFRKLISTAKENHTRNITMEEILWNDPSEEIEGLQNWEYSRRGIGRHFGRNISRKWLRMSGTKVIVRGHEPCQGFKINHDGMIMTLFSCKEAYPNFDAAYIYISDKQLQSMKNSIDLAEHVIKIYK